MNIIKAFLGGKSSQTDFQMLPRIINVICIYTSNLCEQQHILVKYKFSTFFILKTGMLNTSRDSVKII